MCTRPGTDSLQPDHCFWEISAHPHHLCCCYSGCEEVRAALSSSACHSMEHSHGACAWWHRAMRGQDTSGAADRQTGIQPCAVTVCGCCETICLPPNFSSQTHRHVGSMDDCGLGLLREIQSNSTNTPSRYILPLSVLRELKSHFVSQESGERYL